MIICSERKMKVGATVSAGLLSPNGIEVESHPFLVLREATYAEYCADAESYGVSTSGWGASGDAWFYEVTTD